MKELDPYWGEDYEIHKCDHCGIVTHCKYTLDPYQQDIYGIEEESWWCATCHYEACMDI